MVSGKGVEKMVMVMTVGGCGGVDSDGGGGG